MGLSQRPDDLRNFPVNYDTCFNFIMLLNKAILCILFLGLGRTLCYHPELLYYYIQFDVGRRLNNICVLYVLERAKLYKKDTEEERE